MNLYKIFTLFLAINCVGYTVATFTISNKIANFYFPSHQGPLSPMEYGLTMMVGIMFFMVGAFCFSLSSVTDKLLQRKVLNTIMVCIMSAMVWKVYEYFVDKQLSSGFLVDLAVNAGLIVVALIIKATIKPETTNNTNNKKKN